jgi:hypothetical protein
LPPPISMIFSPTEAGGGRPSLYALLLAQASTHSLPAPEVSLAEAKRVGSKRVDTAGSLRAGRVGHPPSSTGGRHRPTDACSRPVAMHAICLFQISFKELEKFDYTLDLFFMTLDEKEMNQFR